MKIKLQEVQCRRTRYIFGKYAEKSTRINKAWITVPTSQHINHQKEILRKSTSQIFFDLNFHDKTSLIIHHKANANIVSGVLGSSSVPQTLSPYCDRTGQTIVSNIYTVCSKHGKRYFDENNWKFRDCFKYLYSMFPTH